MSDKLLFIPIISFNQTSSLFLLIKLFFTKEKFGYNSTQAVYEVNTKSQRVTIDMGIFHESVR
jgi:hypothetical protein